MPAGRIPAAGAAAAVLPLGVLLAIATGVSGQLPTAGFRLGVPSAVGETYPTVTEDEIEGLGRAKDYVRVDSAPFSRLVEVTDNTGFTFAPGASRYMSPRAETKLKALGEQWTAVRAAYGTGAAAARVVVQRAWSAAPAVPPGGSLPAPSLHHEGRAIDLGIEAAPGFDADQATVWLAGAAAELAGFDFVRFAAPGTVYASVLPDSCETRVDLLFVLDNSGSLKEAGWQSEVRFAREVASHFDVGEGASQIATLSFDNNVFLHHDFDEHTTQRSLQEQFEKMLGEFNGGTTYTDDALEWALRIFTEPKYGASPPEEGVPKVAVVLTDGDSRSEYATIRAGEALQAGNVNVFAIGAGSVNERELRGIASDPVSSHYIKLEDVADVGSIVSQIAAFTCEEPAVINPGEEITVPIEPGDFRFFKPLCEVLTESLIVESRDLRGSSNIFISTDQKNPGPFDFTVSATAESGSKLLVVDRGGVTGPIYIGIQGASPDSLVTLDVYNDLFPGASASTAEVMEHFPAGHAVLTMPEPAVLDDAGKPSLVFRIRDDVQPCGLKPSDYFKVGRLSGKVSTTKQLRQSECGEWTLFVTASSDDPATAKCVRGGVQVRIVVAATSSTTVTTTSTVTTSTQTTVTATTSTVTSHTTGTTVSTATSTTRTVGADPSTAAPPDTTGTVAVSTGPKPEATSSASDVSPADAATTAPVVTPSASVDAPGSGSGSADTTLAGDDGGGKKSNGGTIAAIIIVLLAAALLAAFLYRRNVGGSESGMASFTKRPVSMNPQQSSEVANPLAFDKAPPVMKPFKPPAKTGEQGSHGTLGNPSYGVVDPGPVPSRVPLANPNYGIPVEGPPPVSSSRGMVNAAYGSVDPSTGESLYQDAVSTEQAASNGSHGTLDNPSYQAADPGGNPGGGGDGGGGHGTLSNPSYQAPEDGGTYQDAVPDEGYLDVAGANNQAPGDSADALYQEAADLTQWASSDPPPVVVVRTNSYTDAAADGTAMPPTVAPANRLSGDWGAGAMGNRHTSFGQPQDKSMMLVKSAAAASAAAKAAAAAAAVPKTARKPPPKTAPKPAGKPTPSPRHGPKPAPRPAPKPRATSGASAAESAV